MTSTCKPHKTRIQEHNRFTLTHVGKTTTIKTMEKTIHNIARLTYLTLVAIIMAACSRDTLWHEHGELPHVVLTTDKAITFDMKEGNHTRSITHMNRANHYEFGVFTSEDAPYGVDTAKIVMHNYLVGYGPTACFMPWYSRVLESDTLRNDTLYSQSNWIYTTLGNNDPTGPVSGISLPMTKSAQEQQIPKYWNGSASKYYFYAYSPYLPEGDASQPTTMAIGNNDKGEYIHFNGLKAFYTDPIEQTGITTGRQMMDGYKAGESFAGNNTEILNANEALYAANAINSDSYLSDVALIFKHVNAKIRIAFWEDIYGYTAELLDLVPEDVAITYGTGQPSYAGIALTPATVEMTKYPDPQTPRQQLATYYSNAQVRVEGIAPKSDDSRTNFTHIAVGNATTDAPCRDNLRFIAPKDTLLPESRDKAILSPTIYYPLPNYESTLSTPGHITDSRDGTQVAGTTGYTLHVTFRLHPQDDADDMEIYDSRVFIPADKCQWEAGNQYTYIFKLTSNVNGTSNPNTADPTDPTTPWVDPYDPRIPNNKALNSIVLDGLLIENYKEEILSPEFEF